VSNTKKSTLSIN